MNNFRWVANDQVTSSEIGDELALLDPKSGQYFTLNQTGMVVWRSLNEPRSANELTQAVADQFDIDVSDCKSDIDELIARLSDVGLIREA